MIASHEHSPTDFVSKFSTPIKLTDCEIGLKSIVLGSVYNIDEYNVVDIIRYSPHDGLQHMVLSFRNIHLDPGHYTSTRQVFKQLYAKLKIFFDDSEKIYGRHFWGRDDLQYTIVNSKITIKLPSQARLVVKDDQNPLYYLLNTPTGMYNTISNHTASIPIKNEIAFLYTNIIGETYIDNAKSRLLAIIPINGKFFEFKNITYHPIIFPSFTDITFSLKDIQGKTIPLQLTPTILNLHIRKRL